MLSTKARKALRSSELFSGLAPDQLDKIAALGREETYPANTTLLREGDPSEALYVLVEGSIATEVRVPPAKEGEERRLSLGFLGPSSTLGWSSVVEPRILTGSAVCLEETRLVAIEVSRLLSLLEDDPAIGYAVMKRLATLISARLRQRELSYVHELGARED